MFLDEDRQLKKGEKTQKTELDTYGGVAQLGEHLPCKQGVMGSNPIISTNRIVCGEIRKSGQGIKRDGTDKLNGLIAQLVRARA